MSLWQLAVPAVAFTVHTAPAPVQGLAVRAGSTCLCPCWAQSRASGHPEVAGLVCAPACGSYAERVLHCPLPPVLWAGGLQCGRRSWPSCRPLGSVCCRVPGTSRGWWYPLPEAAWVGGPSASPAQDAGILPPLPPLRLLQPGAWHRTSQTAHTRGAGVGEGEGLAVTQGCGGREAAGGRA